MPRLLAIALLASVLLTNVLLVTGLVQSQRARADAERWFNAAAYARHWQARALRWEARADTLYIGLREVQLGAARYAELWVKAEGERDQCRAQF